MPASTRPSTGDGKRRKVFICYKRNIEPDHRLADALYTAFRRNYDVQIDRELNVGTDWVAWITKSIEDSDFFIALLSEDSIRSEMVAAEIQQAHESAMKGGRPKILPVRVRCEGPLPSAIANCIRRIQWTSWNVDEDTTRLISELEHCFRGGEQKPPPVTELTPLPRLNAPSPWADLEQPEGTMDPDSPFYVKREVDAIAAELARQKFFTLTIKGPRQVGKSSLLFRLMMAAREAEKRILFIDFQQAVAGSNDKADQFFREFFSLVSLKLDIEDRVEEFWSRPVSNPSRASNYMTGHVLASGGPLLLALDEVDCIFDTNYRTTFFGMLRSWHNARASEPLWKRLSLVCVTSTEPYLFINDNQSPFNVGEVLEPADFTIDQVRDLNHRHRDPLTPQGVDDLYRLLNGQPYLTRRALYLLTNNRITVKRLFEEAAGDQGPFGDHLRRLFVRIVPDVRLRQGMREVVHDRRCSDEQLAVRLRAAGLITTVERGGIVPRCALYERYFGDRLRV